MANSRSLLVYVLALVLVVCGRSWVSANTVPLAAVRDQPSPTASSSGGTTLQSQPHPQPKHHHPQHHQHPQHFNQEALQQHPPKQNPSYEKSPAVTSSAPSSASPSPIALPSSQQVPSYQPRVSTVGPTTLSVKNGWGLTAGHSADSGPYTSGYGYISGRTIPRTLNASPPESTYMTDYDLPEHAQPRPGGLPANAMNMANMNTDALGQAATGLLPFSQSAMEYSQLLTGVLLGMGAAYSGLPSRIAGMVPILRGYFAAADDEPATEPVSKTNSEKSSSSSRRKKREVVEEHTDLTELASIVLSAIQSGECMQRSICLLGSRIGNSNKGRTAFTLIDKLIPESVQGNQYFVTMKKALKGGESFCERFRCRFN